MPTDEPVQWTDIDALIAAERLDWDNIIANLIASRAPVALGDDDDDTEPEEEESEKDESDDTDEEDDDDEDDTPVTRAEYNSLMKRMQAADKRADAAERERKKAERKGLSGQAQAEAERDDAIKERDELKAQAAEADRDKTIVEMGKALKFKNTDIDHLRRFVDKDSTDAKDIRRDLKSMLKDVPALAGGNGSTPPEVDDEDKGSRKGANSLMNQSIRSAAGRRR